MRNTLTTNISDRVGRDSFAERKVACLTTGLIPLPSSNAVVVKDLPEPSHDLVIHDFVEKQKGQRPAHGLIRQAPVHSKSLMFRVIICAPR